jgi:hypothetical protein
MNEREATKWDALLIKQIMDARIEGVERVIQYDYDNQAWVCDGIYQNCAHPDRMCGPNAPDPCWQRLHAGERAPNIH